MNYFDICHCPEIDYYKGSILLRNVIEELHNPSISLQKLELSNDKYLKFEYFEDRYDDCYKKINDVSNFEFF